jgi:ActR/RegA family two-component response regulator
MAQRKVLLVDDNGDVLRAMKVVLEKRNFEVVAAGGVSEALQEIVSQEFDVLVTDLHMPNPGDGFAVVTAMRHAQPKAMTMVVSGYPDVQQAMAAILLEADAVVTKPFDVDHLIELIEQKTLKTTVPRLSKLSVASILQADTDITIQRWLQRVNRVEELKSLPLSDEERTGHLSAITREIALRLRERPLMETGAMASPAALAHGQLRYRQGYTAPLLVQESRILQVCIFETIKRNLASVDFSILLPDIMLIADEVDSQLTQSVDSFLALQRSESALG